MGTVYLAEQKKPVRRRVALKVIKLGMDSIMVLRRFEAERQALAMMEHDHIARVYEAGTTDRGQPFFAMEYVKGQPITRYCDQHKLSLEERLHLFCQVCSGVQHAHQKGVIHRDLTARNVLITVQDGKPTPKIIDFGIARATNHRLIEATLFTEQGQIIGTPEYMSPEQAGLDALDIDTRSDVYTLGVLLYDLLVGELPFSREELQRGGLMEMERKIREDDPPKPSTRLTASNTDTGQIASLRSTDSSSLTRRLEGDLDWIAMKALEKDRSRRYQTAIELADDIERHLADEPVLATPPSLGYRAGKFVRRYRGRVIAASTVFATLLAGMAGTTIFMFESQASFQSASLLASSAELSQARAALEELHGPAWPESVETLQAWIDDHGAPLERKMGSLERELDALRERGRSTADPSEVLFVDPENRLRHETLTTLRANLQAFLDVELAWVRKRVSWATRVEGLTLAHPDAELTWDQASAAIAKADGVVASVLYGSEYSLHHPIDLKPQLGLVPLGMNPNTRFWEFYHLGSAENPAVIPRRKPDGYFEVMPETGIIFTLLPGRTFWMGAQREDENSDNYDPLALDHEGPPHEEHVAPFFIATHELTQGQRMRLSEDGLNRSFYQPHTHEGVTLAHPADSMSWFVGKRLLEQHGLRLPNNAEWEYACRAGTRTPWYTGEDPESLNGKAHIGSEVGRGPFSPVGSFPPNPFGLFDMAGNLWEWCEDPSPPPFPDYPFRAQRGGHFNADWSRSAATWYHPPEGHAYQFGGRPVRSIQNDDR